MPNIDDFITGPNDPPRGPRRDSDGLAITPERMSDELAKELVQDLDLGDWEVSPWEADFLDSCLQRDHFTVKQKAVVYKMARRLKLI